MFTIEQSDPRFDFPAFDFKLVNRGDGTSVLHRLIVEVETVEVDNTPSLDVSAHVADRNLVIQVIDNGWGPKRQYTLEVSEPVFDLMVPAEFRQASVEMESGAVWAALKVPPVTPASLQQGLEYFQKHVTGALSTWESRNEYWLCRQLEKMLQKGNEGVITVLIDVEGMDLGKGIPAVLAAKCNATGWPDTIETIVRTEYPDGAVHLDKDGFSFYLPEPRYGMGLQSDTMYSVIIDPDAGHHVKEYDISRVVPAGDADRFHVLIGAAKSCHVAVKMRVVADGGGELEIGRYDLHIVNRRCDQFHLKYKDGEVILPPW